MRACLKQAERELFDVSRSLTTILFTGFSGNLQVPYLVTPNAQVAAKRLLKHTKMGDGETLIVFPCFAPES
jgi:hypothetical protein